MRLLVRYLLEGKGEVPNFIEDGGYFSVNEEYVGITVDSSKRHVPSTVHQVTRADLIARISAQNPKKMYPEQGFLSQQEIEAMVDAFLLEKGLA